MALLICPDCNASLYSFRGHVCMKEKPDAQAPSRPKSDPAPRSVPRLNPPQPQPEVAPSGNLPTSARAKPVVAASAVKQSRAKETKGKTVKSDDVPKTERVSSRLHSGRTEENAAPSSDAGRVAIQDGLDDGVPLIKIGRPKITDPAKMSRSTRYRRKAEERKP